MQIAQANIAWMKWPMTDPRVADFTDALERINRLAEYSDGFVWRHIDTEGDPLRIRELFGGPSILFNMSVWESIETVFRYAYHSGHVEYFRRRREWFKAPDRPTNVLWWVEDGHHPSLEECRERFERLWTDVPTPDAFGFRDAMDAEGRPLTEGWRRELERV